MSLFFRDDCKRGCPKLSSRYYDAATARCNSASFIFGHPLLILYPILNFLLFLEQISDLGKELHFFAWCWCCSSFWFFCFLLLEFQHSFKNYEYE